MSPRLTAAALVAAAALTVVPSSAAAAPGATVPGSAAAGTTRVLVEVAPDADPAAVAASHGGRVAHVLREVGRGFVADVPAAAAAALARDPRVVSVEADQVVRADDLLPSGVARIGAALDPGSATAGVGADVAVLDTGIDGSHPDLAVAGGVDCRSGTCVVAAATDPAGHGTHVAGTIGARQDGSGVVGVAPGVRLWSVRVLEADGTGRTSSVVAALDWLAARGDVEVANLSFGCRCSSAALDGAVQRSVAAGLVLVVSAGNEGADAGEFSPARHPDVIAVSAMADFDGLPGGTGSGACPEADDTFASFSNYGAVVDLAAPGVCITSTWPGGRYARSSGTSMAAPHVAGAAARYIAERSIAAGSGRAAAVRDGLRRDWSTSPGGPCGFTGGRSAEPLLHLTCAPPPNAAPTVTIDRADATGLAGRAADAEDGDLSGRIAWRSDLQGDLGTGATVAVALQPGTHAISASVTDASGATASAAATVVVAAPVSSGGGGGGGGSTAPAPSPSPTPTDEPAPTDEPVPTTSPTAVPFTDVDPASVHAAAIAEAVAEALANGTSPTTFSPERGVTRAQMATFVVNLVARAGGDLPDAPDHFGDDEGSLHEGNIDRLAAAGIVSGLPDGTYAPSAPVTRAQMATFLVRAHAYVTGRAPAEGVDAFSDDDGSPHEANIDAAAALGLATGTGDGLYRPDLTVRRDQMASFLVRALRAATA